MNERSLLQDSDTQDILGVQSTMASPFLIVVAGGSGTRFWPKSTSKRPKQFLSFGKDVRSLLARTVDRFQGWIPSHQQWVMTTADLKASVLQEKLGVDVFAEPQARNTAPCIYWAARKVAKINPQAVMLIMPSDHAIQSEEKFLKVVKRAVQWATQKDDLVTLGICPSRPETGYGYLQLSEQASLDPDFPEVRSVEAFVEKPPLEKAQEFLRLGHYLWNGGMFIWRAEVILEAFDQWMPAFKEIWDKAQGEVGEAYFQMPSISIDYAIMEKAKNVVTFPLDCGWDDLGSWISLENLRDENSEINLVEQGELVAIDAQRNIIDAPKHAVALLGVDDLIIVAQGESLLIAQKSRAQEIRFLVEELKKTRPDLV